MKTPHFIDEVGGKVIRTRFIHLQQVFIQGGMWGGAKDLVVYKAMFQTLGSLQLSKSKTKEKFPQNYVTSVY